MNRSAEGSVSVFVRCRCLQKSISQSSHLNTACSGNLRRIESFHEYKVLNNNQAVSTVMNSFPE